MSAIAHRLTAPGLLRPLAGLALLATTAGAGTAQQGARVSGRVVVLDRGDKPARDVGQAVVWLEATRPASVAPADVEVVTSDKEFRPRVTVVSLGSTVSFPNTDPFDHNVFSLTEEAPFDLGLYGRGQAKSHRFAKPGIVRVYCNVHAQMSAFVVVRDSPWYTQPAGDGSFVISGVPQGEYVAHAWHERAGPFVPQAIRVTADGTSGLDLRLDARGYKFVQHLNKFGQPYGRRGRRY